MRKLLRQHPVGAVCALALVCFAPLLLVRDFSLANELRYLSIADEALSDGHFFAFFNHGAPYADKPPLYFWILMLCRAVFGKHSLTALCLFSLLPAFGIAAVLDRWAFRDETPSTRAAAAMMLLTTAMFLAMAVFVRMDMLMCLWIVLALYAFSRGRSGWFGFLTFLALFTKGPVGLLLPPLGAVAFLLATGRWREIGKHLNGTFSLALAVPALGWLLGVWLEGGRDYFLNLTVHQTVGRAVHSFHHQAPFWFYCAAVWGAAAPWSLLTVPVLLASFHRPVQVLGSAHKSGAERLFAWTAVAGFVLLSLFSSKLALYLLPLMPFLVATFVLTEQRLGWRPWMRVLLRLIALVLAVTGLAAFAGWFVFDRLPIPEDYAFAHTPLLLLSGALLAGAGIYAFCTSRRGWQRPVLTLGAALLLCILIASPLLPHVNELSSYGPLCEQIREQGAPDAEVWTIGLKRPENMDVYLGRPVTAVEPEAFVQDPSQIPAGATVVLDAKKDAAASGRYSSILLDSGRSRVCESDLYAIWR